MTNEQSLRNVSSEITVDLNLALKGDADALERAYPKLVRELEKLAQARLRSFGGRLTLDAQSLLHDVYLKLPSLSIREFSDRSHFFCVASRMMRFIILDHARARQASKRGQRDEKITLSGLSDTGRLEDVLAVHLALTKLEGVDETYSKVVEMKFFGGLTMEQIAEATGLSPSTVNRKWEAARKWLEAHLDP